MGGVVMRDGGALHHGKSAGKAARQVLPRAYLFQINQLCMLITWQWRNDVLSHTGPMLDKPMKLASIPKVHLSASTSGSDSDWVVKLIDVYPDQNPDDPKMAGYQLPLAVTIFRGRYRESFSQPRALTPDAPLSYSFDLPNVNHTVQPGHRLMVQVQSSLFPLYDRNPQRYVDNIFFAKPGDYQKANQRIWNSSERPSYVTLPMVE